MSWAVWPLGMGFDWCMISPALGAQGRDRMQNRLASLAISSGLIVAAVAGFIAVENQSKAAPAPQAAAPADTAALRAQYEQWRTQFKTWGKWAPVGQESRGTSSLITPEKTAAALKLVRNGIAISLAHAEPQEVAADVNA